MADLDALSGFLNAHKRVLDALPRIQDEAIESGDYTKVDNAHEALSRLEAIGGKIIDDHGIATPGENPPGLLGPTGDIGEEGVAGAPGVLPVEGPALLAPTPKQPQQQAPVVVNVGTQASQPEPYPQGLNAKQAPRPALLAPRRDISGTGFEVPAQPQGSLPYTGRQGEEPSTPTPPQYDEAGGRPAPQVMIPGWMPPSAAEMKKLRADFDAISSGPTLLAPKQETPQAPAITTASLARDLHTTMMDAAKKNQLLGISPEQLANIPFTDLNKLMELAKTVRPYTQDYMSDRQLSDKISGLAERINTYKAVDEAAAARKPAPALLQQPEFDEAGTGVVPPGGEAPEPPFVRKSLADATKPDTFAKDFAADLEAKNGSPFPTPSVQPVPTNAAGDAAAEVRRRIDLELSGHPGAPKKKTFLDYLALILTGGKVAAIWNQQRSDYEHAKEKIGSEVYNTAKAKLIADEQYKRLQAQIEAANKRQDKQLAYRSAADKAANDIRNSQMQQQWNIANLRLVPQHRQEQAKALQTKINTLNKEYDDISRQLQSFAITPDQWNTMTKPNREEVYKVQGQYDDLVATQPTEVQLPTVKEAPPQPQK